MVKDNKEAYERLGYDSSGLVIAIWRSCKEAVDQEEWLSAEMRTILEDLLKYDQPSWSPKFYTDNHDRHRTLENICSFVDEQLSKRKVFRVIFSRADGVKIKKYREHLNYAMQKFEVRPSVKSRIFLVDTCY
jgi:hypothetical protein